MMIIILAFFLKQYGGINVGRRYAISNEGILMYGTYGIPYGWGTAYEIFKWENLKKLKGFLGFHCWKSNVGEPMVATHH